MKSIKRNTNSDLWADSKNTTDYSLLNSINDYVIHWCLGWYHKVQNEYLVSWVRNSLQWRKVDKSKAFAGRSDARALLCMLLLIGNIEANPGPNHHELRMKVCAGRFIDVKLFTFPTLNYHSYFSIVTNIAANSVVFVAAITFIPYTHHHCYHHHYHHHPFHHF